MPVPYAFSAATSAIPLSQLDANFNTTITLGNTAIQLGNTVTTLNNMTLANVTISSGNVTLTNVTVTTANVTTANITTAIIGTANVTTANVATSIITTSETLSYGTANGVAYLNGSKVLTTGSALTFDGTTLTASSGGSTPALKLYGAAASQGQLQFSSTSGYGIQGGPDYTGLVYNVASSSYQHIFNIGGSEQMRLTSSGLEVKQSQLIGYSSYAGIGTNGLAVAGNVGIGTSSPAYKLDVAGDIGLKNNATYLYSKTSGGTVVRMLGINSGNTAYVGPIDAGPGDMILNASSSSVNIQFYASGTEKMRLTSTGLGIGTSSPGQKLEVVGNSFFNGAIGVGTPAGTYGGQIDVYANSNSALNGIWVRNDSAGSSSNAGIVLNASGNSWRMSMGSTANNGNALTWNADASGANTERMRLDASGNLGLGVTPSAWSQGRAFELLNPGYGFWNGSGSPASMYMLANAYYNGGFKYGGTGQASHYYQYQGAHVWSTAASGLVGDPITFTQAMTLDASGNLLVGTTTVAVRNLTSGSGARIGPAGQLELAGASGTNYINITDASGTMLEFRRQGPTAVGSITTNGTITVYGTTSDYRLKTVIGPVAGAGQRIDALQPVEYTWNADGSRTRGFLAHQFQEVYAGSVSGTKDAVDAEGKPVYQSMQASTSEVIADLVAELQSLRQRVVQLEGK